MLSPLFIYGSLDKPVVEKSECIDVVAMEEESNADDINRQLVFLGSTRERLSELKQLLLQLNSFLVSAERDESTIILFSELQTAIESVEDCSFSQIVSVSHDAAMTCLKLIADSLRSRLVFRESDVAPEFLKVCSGILESQVCKARTSILEIVSNEREKHRQCCNAESTDSLPNDVSSAVEDIQHEMFVVALNSAISKAEDQGTTSSEMYNKTVTKSIRKWAATFPRENVLQRGYGRIAKSRLFESLKIAIGRHIFSCEEIENEARRKSVLKLCI